MSNSGQRVHVLRLGHRLVRDDRTTTHTGLVARAFGADRIYIVGADRAVKDAIDDVTKRWGGSFEVRIIEEWRGLVSRWKQKGGLVVHLTMYGVPLDEAISSIRKADRDVLVIVGAGKVPSEVFELADNNMAVGHQPHSEVAALAVFLDRFHRGQELYREFEGASLRVAPTPKGKRMFEARSNSAAKA